MQNFLKKGTAVHPGMQLQLQVDFSESLYRSDLERIQDPFPTRPYRTENEQFYNVYANEVTDVTHPDSVVINNCTHKALRPMPHGACIDVVVIALSEIEISSSRPGPES